MPYRSGALLAPKRLCWFQSAGAARNLDVLRATLGPGQPLRGLGDSPDSLVWRAISPGWHACWQAGTVRSCNSDDAVCYGLPA